jgi:hypothetical protein
MFRSLAINLSSQNLPIDTSEASSTHEHDTAVESSILHGSVEFCLARLWGCVCALFTLRDRESGSLSRRITTRNTFASRSSSAATKTRT